MKKERRQKAQSSKQQELELYCLFPPAFCFLLSPLSSLRPPQTRPLVAAGTDFCVFVLSSVRLLFKLERQETSHES
jgi:hypothetical protein